MSNARKRQKTEHVSSDEDDASFVSFSDTEQRDLEVHDDDDEQLDDLDEDEEDEMDDGEDVEAEESTTATKDTRESRANGHLKSTQHKPTSQAVLNGKSGIFDTQVDQLLQQIRPKHTAREVEAEEALHLIKTTIDALPNLGPYTLQTARKALGKENIAIPFPAPGPPADTNLKFSYEKPSSINVVGSYPMKTASRARKFLYIDMVVQMPSTLFQEKDYLDHRYFYKRAFYLASVASALQAAHLKDLDIRFQCHHDDSLRPVISIRSRRVNTDTSKPARNWQINILPSIADDVFPAGKLLPSNNCVRKGRAENTATPAYNSSIRADMLVTAYLKILHKASTTCEAYKDACSLGSTWLRQRGFRATSRKGGVASFEWSALLALLLIGGGPSGRAVISERWDSTQMFKAALQYLTTKDLVKQPVSIGSGQTLDSTELDLPILWDAVRAHNIFHKVPIWSYRRLQTEAKLTLAMLSDKQFNGFEAAFIVRKDVELLDYDVVIELRTSEATPYEDTQFYNKIYGILRRALGDRVKSMQITAERSKPWELASVRTRSAGDNLVKIGLAINPDNVNRLVDHGPSVEDKTASASFRKFWGDKSELRRFKDGSITEALIWETGPGKAAILEQIVKYILHLHLKVDADKDITLSADLQTQILGARSAESSLQASEAFKTLEQDIRSLEGLPLPIRQIIPAALDRPSSKPSKKNTTRSPRDVVMQFESSGRWPDDLAAIQRTKIAFLLRISELLHESNKSMDARVGLENQEHDIRNQSFLDVVYGPNAAFRIRIFHDREQTLLERQLKDKKLDATTVELAAAALAVFKRDYLRRPAHAQAIAGLCSRHPALRGTIEMLEKWLAQHVLANHFEKEIVELFAARTFVQPWPWQAPNSVQTGFFRTLAWLARWDWRFEPLIVDMSSTHELKSAITPIHTRFEAWRKLDPAFNRVTIFAASNVDSDGTTYTTDGPSKVVVSRLLTLAKAAVQEVQTQGLMLDYRTLFTSSLADYDFVLHLSSQSNTRVSAFKNLELEAASEDIGFVPNNDLLEELQTAYGSAILFFSGHPHRAAIGGVWTPQTADRPWKVNLSYSTRPISSADATQAQINKTAILAEIARLGGDLVERIEVVKK